MNTKKVAFLCMDYPDYFSGFHYPVCQIPVYGNMTYLEVAEAIESELQQVWEYLFYEYPSHERLYRKYIQELKKTPDELFVEYKPNKEEEEEADFFEGPYLYFSVIEEKYSNNIKFLG